MESSYVLGGSYECSSNESGWTMYLLSPSHEEDYGYSGDNGPGTVYNDNRQYDKDDGSDDSLASDASSRPSHLLGLFKKPEKEGQGKCSSLRKFYKQVEKKFCGRPKTDKEVQRNRANSGGVDSAQSEAKSRKSNKTKKKGYSS